jgi:hypothetical protein
VADISSIEDAVDDPLYTNKDLIAVPMGEREYKAKRRRIRKDLGYEDGNNN